LHKFDEHCELYEALFAIVPSKEEIGFRGLGDKMSLKDPNVVNPRNRKKVAIVLSNPAVSSTTGWPVGFWWSELAHPYFVLTEKGYEIEVFSSNGGKCEADAMSDPRDPSDYSSSDLISMGFLSTPKLAALIQNTKKASEIDVQKFDGILVAGGQGPCSRSRRRPHCTRNSWSFMKLGRLPARCATELPFSATRS
jgi:hypothetical protein